jgi:hypothetical protein
MNDTKLENMILTTKLCLVEAETKSQDFKDGAIYMSKSIFSSLGIPDNVIEKFIKA